jgi:hypothetical protein
MVLVVALVAAVVAMTGLGAAGVNFAWYPTSVMVIPGLAWAAIAAARANWLWFGTGLRDLLGGLLSEPLAPGTRAGDADRDAAAAALGEHFAQGRLTLDELSARLDATLTATTHGELSQAAQDLPDLTPFPAQARFPRRTRVFARPAWSCRLRRRPATTAGRASW